MAAAGAAFTVLIEIAGDQLEEMRLSVSPLADTVRSVRVFHHGEWLVAATSALISISLF